ncbi:MAG: hypothetical protein Q7J10_00830, partial [Methanosarcinaceae archaeon]|nr:hypothetical protein [Methanosarcinaceae archaeon]
MLQAYFQVKLLLLMLSISLISDLFDFSDVLTYYNVTGLDIHHILNDILSCGTQTYGVILASV